MKNEDDKLMQCAIDQIMRLLSPIDDSLEMQALRESFRKVVGEIACMFYVDEVKK